MRRKIVAAVWKDRLTNSQSIEAARKIAQSIGGLETNFDVLIAASPIALADVSRIIADTRIKLCAQHMDWKRTSGSYIGEVTAEMLRDVGCPYVMIGHSERRRFFGETDETVNKRLRTALEAGITPIICLSVNLEQKEAGLLEEVTKQQILGALKGFESNSDLSELILAFEPVWAISTWREEVPLPEPSMIDGVHQYIRDMLSENLSENMVERISVVYGGSVDPKNGAGYFSQPHIDGALVGGASLSPDSFVRVVKVAKESYGAEDL